MTARTCPRGSYWSSPTRRLGWLSTASTCWRSHANSLSISGARRSLLSSSWSTSRSSRTRCTPRICGTSRTLLLRRASRSRRASHPAAGSVDGGDHSAVLYQDHRGGGARRASPFTRLRRHGAQARHRRGVVRKAGILVDIGVKRRMIVGSPPVAASAASWPTFSTRTASCRGTAYAQYRDGMPTIPSAWRCPATPPPSTTSRRSRPRACSEATRTGGTAVDAAQLPSAADPRRLLRQPG